MKHLLSDDWVAKIRKMPDFVFMIFAAISFFFADAYAIILSGELSVMEYGELFAETGMEGVTLNLPFALALFCIAEAIFSEVIFEIVNHVASGVFIARFSAKTTRRDFKFRLRLCVIYANLLIGIIGICYFFTQYNETGYTGVLSLLGDVPNSDLFSNDVYTILSSVVPYSAFVYFMWLFFDDFGDRFFSPKNKVRAFLYTARLYFGITVAFRLIDAVWGVIAQTSSLTVCEIVSPWVSLGVALLWCVPAFLYYKNLKKKQDEWETSENDEFKIVEKEQTKAHNIYDDLGF